MNHLKDYIKQNTNMMHFLTYADNYAIGYFRKQVSIGMNWGRDSCVDGNTPFCIVGIYDRDHVGSEEMGGIHQGL